ncbi:arsenosugar biosynthesis radical SAM protein ArsS [bacterium]|nr:arsenosugar biosynthesis radical SAM protein ArsS [bacterium]
MLDTRPLLLETTFPAIKRTSLELLQVNLGYLCNLSCVHCHVNAGPKRTELMDLKNIDLLLAFAKARGIKTLDLTGGAPEMNPHFRYLVTQARAMDIEVIDRCNLTILLEPGYEDLAQFLADNQVVITASLPCYMEENVEQQRGKGVYNDSIEALRLLNSLGYGRDKTRVLNLVFNPTGTSLPPSQPELQADYKRELKQRFDIDFDYLYTITNMPISRFGSMLISKNQFDPYMQLLKDNYSADNLKTVMCKSLISVDWQGYVYDCDFNQMLEMPLMHSQHIASDKVKTHLSDLLDVELAGESIVVGEHCFGCTAGQGSSCGGALSD